VAGIGIRLTPALQPLTGLKQRSKHSGPPMKRAVPSARKATIALGAVRVTAKQLDVSYTLPVTVAEKLRRPGAAPLTQSVFSATIAEVLAEVKAAEGTGDCSVGGLRLQHSEVSPLGNSVGDAPPTGVAAAESGAEFARQSWEHRDLVHNAVPSSPAASTDLPSAPQSHGVSLLQMQHATVILRRMKYLVWAAGSAPVERLGGAKLSFDVCADYPVLTFSTDAAFALLAMAVEVTAAVAVAKLQPAQPVTASTAKQLPKEVEKAATAAVVSAGDAIQVAQREDRLRGSVRVLGARVQLPLNDGYTFTSTVSDGCEVLCIDQAQDSRVMVTLVVFGRTSGWPQHTGACLNVTHRGPKHALCVFRRLGMQNMPWVGRQPESQP